MKSIRIFIPLSLAAIIGCNKTANLEGTVYSKHNIAVPNAVVGLSIPANSSQVDGIALTTTDNEGHYYFDFKTKYKKTYRLTVSCDSGFAASPDFTAKALKKTVHHDLFLH